MNDLLQIAEKRLFRLEIFWLIAVSFGTLVAIEFGFVSDSSGQVSASNLTSILSFLALSIFLTPFNIFFLLPCWNFISPIQNRHTIWETEFVVLMVTSVCLTILSSHFFGVSTAGAIKTQVLIASAFLPILWLSAQYRWYVHTEEIRGQVFKAAPTLSLIHI